MSTLGSVVSAIKAASVRECGKNIQNPTNISRSNCRMLKDHPGNCSPDPEPTRQGFVVPIELVVIHSEIQKQRNSLAQLEAKATELKKGILIKCVGWSVNFRQDGCGAEHKVSMLEYIQTHWYTRPSGCTEGDYWNLGEGQFICPSCGKKNRLVERPEVTKLKPFFATVKDLYEN
jgi:hypothetical protein